MQTVLHYSHDFAYTAIGITAVYGIYNVVLLWRQLRRRRFRTVALAGNFVDEVREHIRNNEFEEADDLCRSPKHWYTALARLTREAIERRNQPLGKLRGDLMSLFGREILTDLETHLAGINMVVKAEPMLGLMGTVLGMIGAFSEIALMKTPSPQQLMGHLSVALYCTALGLISSIPLLMIGNALQARIRRLEEQTLGFLGDVLEELRGEPAATAGRGR